MNSRTNHQEEEIPPHEHSQVDVRTISAPILTMISLVGFVVWATWVVTTERYKIRDEFEAQIQQNTEDIRKLDAYDHDTLAKETEKMKLEILALHDELKMEQEQIQGTIKQQNEVIGRIRELLVKVRERQLYVLENIWTRDDHNNWCREVEKKNPNWVCPLYESADRKRFLLNPEQQGINNSLSEDLKRALEEDPNQLWQSPETKHPTNSNKK